MSFRFSVAAAIVSALWFTSVRADIVAHYTFDESSGTIAHDTAGSVNGTITGSPTFVAGGISGNAINIPGNGFVNMGNNFGFTSGSFSVVAWVKIGNGDTTGMIPVAKHHATTNAGHFLAINNVNDVLGAGGNNKAHFYDSGPTSGASTTTVNDGQWHQLIGIYDTAASQARIAVDGTIQSSASAAAIVGISAPFMVGGIENSSSVLVNNYNGLVDDVQLYNTALNGTDVAFLFAHPGSPLPEPGLVSATAMLAVGLGTRRRRCTGG